MNDSSEINENETYNIVSTIIHPGPCLSSNGNNEEESINTDTSTNGRIENASQSNSLQPSVRQSQSSAVKVPGVPSNCGSSKLPMQTHDLISKPCIRTTKSMIALNIPGRDSNCNGGKCCERKFSSPIAGVHSRNFVKSSAIDETNIQAWINNSNKCTPRINLSKNRVAPGPIENTCMQIKTTVPEDNDTEAQTEGNRAFSTTSFDSLADLCRICHDNPSKLQLMTPCRCKGSMGMVHLSCLERWLSESGKNTCEICGHEYNTTRRPKYTGLNAFCAWIRKPLSQNDIRNLFFDIACFFILTPLAAVSSWLCVNGAQQYSVDHHFYKGKVVENNEPSNNTWTAIGLLSLTGTLVVAYLVWLFIAARYHTNVWREWQSRNFVVTIIPFVEQEQTDLVIQTSDVDSHESLNAANNNNNSGLASHALHDSNNNANSSRFSRRSSESTFLYTNTSDDEMVFASMYERDSMQRILGSCSNLPEIHNYMAHATPVGAICNSNQEALVSVRNVDSTVLQQLILQQQQQQLELLQELKQMQENTTNEVTCESTTESSNSSAETETDN